MSDIDPNEAQRISSDAQMDRWAAHLREVMRKALGIPVPRDPWDEEAP